MCTQDKDTDVRIPQLGYHDILLITEMAHARPLLDMLRLPNQAGRLTQEHWW